MKPIKIDLPKDLEQLELHIFADEHIGDAHSDLKNLEKRIEYVKNTPNAYAILNGDLMDNATKTSVSDIYSATMQPEQQMDLLVDLFKPIKNKILCATLGNHEARTYKKEGINPMKCICDRLGIIGKYTDTSACIFLRFGPGCSSDTRGRKMRYVIFVNHGSGGGRKEGAKAIRLADMAGIVDADIYIHAHTHLPMTMKENFVRVDINNSTIKEVPKLFVNSSANLTYGGYGETLEMKPSCTDKPVIYLDGVKRDMKAML